MCNSKLFSYLNLLVQKGGARAYFQMRRQRGHSSAAGETPEGATVTS